MAPCGDRCLVVEFAQTDVAQSNDMACEAARRLQDANLRGVTDIVPSIAAVSVHYDPATVAARGDRLSPWRALVADVEQLLSGMQLQQVAASREVVIPVCYGGAYGEDLVDVAHACGLTAEEVIHIHSANPVNVLMLGFAPGHPYIGMFDPRLTVGRRATPRTAVTQGSIGLANRQSVIYPMTLPGGWNIIGRTPLKLFDPYCDSPCLLIAGDCIRFESITERQFEEIEQQQDGAQ
jgi:KipI family sensor histidine kinase inhibitor